MSIRMRGALLVAAFLSVAATPLAAQQPKIAFVNTQRILAEMPQRAAAEAQMRTALEALSARQQVMVDSLNGMIAAFEKDSATLAQPERVARFQAMQAYDARYRDTLEVLERESQAAQAAVMQPLYDQIRVALDEVRTADSYTMILDLSAQTSQVVAFDRNLDISDKVLARIRASAAPARPGTAPAAQRPPAQAPAGTPPATTPARPATPGPVAQPSGVRRP
jgi:outer membrane protein